ARSAACVEPPRELPATLSRKGSLSVHERQRQVRRDPQGPARIPDRQNHRGRQGLRRRHPPAPQRDGVRHAGRHALSAPQQDAPRRARGLRVARIRRGTAAQVLQAHRRGDDAARGTRQLLARHQHDDRSAWTVAMQKVIGINLNGNAYQIEERGYEALLAYLDRAEAALKDNPDQAEIISDLEQAIAEKCQKFLASHKTVVMSAEVDQIIREMGPVDTGGAVAAGGDATGTAAGEKTEPPRDKDRHAPKRLYQIREGAMLSGVCKGIAAYLNVDVTLVRIVFVILAILTKGVWLLVYGVMMFVVPYANT